MDGQNKTILMLGNSELVIFGFRKELIQRLVADGYRVVACFPQTYHGDGYTSAERFGCEYIPIDLTGHGTNPLTELRLLKDYKKIINKVEPDIVFSYTIKPNIYGGLICKNKKIPYVPNVSGLGTAVENPGLLQFVTLALYRIALKRARTVFFQNRENLQFFLDRGLAVKSHKLLPGSGVNTDVFLPAEYPSDKQFCFIGRILKEKGIEEYVEAARQVRKVHPDAIFHVIGGCDDDYGDYLAAAQNEGVIIYHGHSNNVADYIKQCCCTVLPSYHEGLSNVLLESAATARPLITSDCSGCRETVDDGVNGLLTKPRDAKHLEEQINAFLELDYDTRRNMGIAGRAKVEREFDRQIVINSYLSEIDEVLNAK